MKEAIAFAQHLAESTSDPALIRWAERMEELVAKQALYLVPRAALMSPELQKDYLAVLTSTFEAISKDVKIEASAMLVESIDQLEAPELKSAILEHVLVAD